MRYTTSTKGQSLIEILFAIAIFTIGVVTIGYLILDSFASLRLSAEFTRARLLAVEGIEAARSLRDGSFDALAAGTYGLARQDGAWALNAEADTIGKFERDITIVDVDEEIKEVTASVIWETRPSVFKEVTVVSLLSNWEQTKGDASMLSFDIHDAMLFSSSTAVTGAAVVNNDTEDVTITEMIVQFDEGPLLERIALNGTAVFTASTSAPVSSGERIDIVDYTVPTATGFHILDADFNGNIAGSSVLFTLVLADGSYKRASVSL